jgi:DNA polymerase I-like protein with 3'-5' exonuclease and polymerase domains
MIIYDKKDLHKFIEFASKHQKLSFDLETNSLNPRTGIVMGIGISTDTEGVYIKHHVWDGNKIAELIPKEDILTALKSLKGKLLTGWNLSFDAKFVYNFYNLDLLPEIWSDGMLAKHTVEEDYEQFGNFALKDNALRVFGEDATKEQEEMKASIKANGGKPTDFYKADSDLLGLYCIKDCILAYKLNEYYLQKIEEEGLTKFYFEDEVMPLYRLVTIPMELHGIPVNVPYLKQSQEEIAIDLKKLEDQILDKIIPILGPFKEDFFNKNYPVKQSGTFAQTLAILTEAQLALTPGGAPSLAAKEIQKLKVDHPLRVFMESGIIAPELKKQVQDRMHGNAPIFNLRSKDNLSYLFFSILREKPTSFTDKGRPQVDNEFLAGIKNKYDFISLLVAFNKLTKISGTYIDQILEKQIDGTFYPSFQMHKTISGRMGSDTQQLPRKLEDGEEVVLKYNNRIRDFFISGSNARLVGADYESLEPKIFAHVSGDQNLKNIFLNGLDFYSEIALRTEKLEGVSSDKKAHNYLGKVNKDARQKAKAYSLGIPYGLTGYKLHFELEIDLRTADQLVEDYLQAFPDLRQWMQDTHLKVNTLGYIKTQAGRIRHMPEAPDIYAQYGDDIKDSLKLWKRFHEEPALYRDMKKLRRKYINLLNNGCNFQIQSLAASIVNRACIAMARIFASNGISARVVLQVHDEIVVWCQEDEAEKVAEIMEQIMENNYKISIPLIAKPEIGTIYGELK